MFGLDDFREMEKKEGENRRENGWKGRGDIKPVGSMCFLFKPTKTQSPQIGEKIKSEELLRSND